MSDLFLKVEISVEDKGSNKADFLQKLKQFVGSNFLQERHKWTLVAGFEVEDEKPARQVGHVAPAERAAASHGSAKPPAKFINIWRLQSPLTSGDVAKVMLELNDIPVYVELDALVQTETQDLVIGINSAIGSVDIKPGTSRFALVRHLIDRPLLGEFAFTSGALVPDVAQATKWNFLGTFQAVTGLLNVFWDLWEIKGEAARGVEERLDNFVVANPAKAVDKIVNSYKHSIGFDSYYSHDGLLVGKDYGRS